MPKKLSEMDNRELFVALSTGEDVIMKAQIKHIAREWLTAHGRSELTDGDNLKEMVDWYFGQKRAGKE
ncbi:MAG: hypothetical protein IKE30_01905 [Clostridia bacterium]|nr:hypothetical protein [Clostridia bacterium]